MVSPALETPAPLPRSLVFHPRLSDEEFEQLSMNCELASLERTEEGAIVVSAPAGSMTSDGKGEINEQLRRWWKSHRQGKAYESSAGFFLPDGAMLTPDASYFAGEQLQGLTRDDRSRFLHIAPAFVIELISPSDRLSTAQAKMEAWISNGVRLGWLVDPQAKQIRVYEAGAQPRIEAGSKVAGSGPVDGFVLDLEEVWSCFR